MGCTTQAYSWRDSRVSMRGPQCLIYNVYIIVLSSHWCNLWKILSAIGRIAFSLVGSILNFRRMTRKNQSALDLTWFLPYVIRIYSHLAILAMKSWPNGQLSRCWFRPPYWRQGSQILRWCWWCNLTCHDGSLMDPWPLLGLPCHSRSRGWGWRWCWCPFSCGQGTGVFWSVRQMWPFLSQKTSINIPIT